MDILKTIIDCLPFLFSLAMGGVAYYFNKSEKAQAKAKEVAEVIGKITAQAVVYIADAEEKYKDTTKAGGIKFNEVVDKLYELVPDAAKVVITRKMIEEIVQSTFEEIEKYLSVQADKTLDKIKTK